MLTDPRSHGLWEKTASTAPNVTGISGDSKKDVVIVGGGYTGLSAALHLAEAGAKVGVLEAMEIGYGASGRNSGFVNAGLWMKPDDVVSGLGEPFGERLVEILGNGPSEVWSLIDKHAIDCDVVKNGTLHCAVGESGLRELLERSQQWQSRNAPVQLLSAEETTTRIGATAYSGSLFDPRAGTIQPLSYARGLARAAITSGARVYCSSKVTRAERSNAKWKVHTAAGSIEADWVIVATDAYTNNPWQEVRREQVLMPYFNIATRPLSTRLQETILPGHEGCWDTKKVLSAFRLDRDGRLILGSIGALRGTGVGIHRAWAKRAIRRLFPQLGEIELDAEWYGMIGTTDNHLPRFHHLAPNVLSVSGYNGRGIAPGTVFGRLLSEYILGKVEDIDFPLPITPCENIIFRSSKESYYEMGAKVSHFLGARL